jgi:predicted phage baseplate assembly protein
MPLDIQTPLLDNSTFDQIVRRARLRIPRYAPEWTDFNESDPGMTLVELFAWLTESMLYQMNQIPERNYLKFLQVLGLDLDPPQPAHAQLVFSAAPGTATQSIPQGAPVGAQPASGGDLLIFETAAGLDLIRLPLTDVQVFDGGAFTTVTPANITGDATFRPFGWTARPGSALYLGFDPGDKPSAEPIFPEMMRWRVWMPPSANARTAISARALAQTVFPAPPVRLVWEFRPKATPNRWRHLETFMDDSVAFTREGSIQVQGPAETASTREGRVVKERYWLRVRVDSGAYSSGGEPVIAFIRPNVVEAVNVATVRGESLGLCLGAPDQTFQLFHFPVIVKSLQLTILDETDPQTNEPWQQVDDFLGSGPEDKHYILNAASGLITLGDGQNGRVPPAGSPVTATLYQYGGGSAGNVNPGEINTLLTSLTGVASVINPRSAAGGRDEEDISDFIRRAPAVLRHRNQAISAGDMTEIASQVGGILRAKALPLFHPDFPGIDVPGAVTIVVVAKNTSNPPVPTPQQLEAVCRQLEPHRLLTTELYVQGPRYHEVRVEAQILADPYAAFDQVRAQVISAINADLDPRTREFGLDLYPNRLFSVIQSVANVKAVSGLQVYIDGQLQPGLEQAVVLDDDEMLFGATDHDITVTPYRDQ